MEHNMAEENGNDKVSESLQPTQAESGVIINAAQMQSIDISERFTRVKTAAGWRIQLNAPGRVTINFMNSMRKFETTLMQDDIIERDGEDLILLRNQAADAYRSQRGVSPLARSVERKLASEPADGRPA